MSLEPQHRDGIFALLFWLSIAGVLAIATLVDVITGARP
jgi:hypothetical protein